MKLYQINYDLRAQRDYQLLFKKMRSYESWACPLGSCWIVATSKSVEQVGGELEALMDEGDGLLVVRLQGEASWQNLDGDRRDKMTNWLKKRLGEAA